MESVMRHACLAAAALLLTGCNDEDHYVQSNGTTVILLSTSAEGTLAGATPLMAKITADLSAAGFSLLAMDLPCEGGDADPDGNKTITCWRSRIEAGDTQLFKNYCDELSGLISRLQLNEAFIIGESRGGYVAATCAANDPRITKVVLLKPVTDLQLLAEFAGYTVDESIFGLAATVPELSHRPVLLRIGPNDTRVSTESAIAYGESIGADVQVVPSEGHDLLDDGTTTAWLKQP